MEARELVAQCSSSVPFASCQRSHMRGVTVTIEALRVGPRERSLYAISLARCVMPASRVGYVWICGAARCACARVRAWSVERSVRLALAWLVSNTAWSAHI